ncbi:nuclear transport factor 2 family protein [Streptomyces coeruleorubidus]|uniref:nuclear transport factor 2 family protein n=1 Tax=Streptomyces coeruleorubidus TaxID=116188 RepID=UPI0036CB9C11
MGVVDAVTTEAAAVIGDYFTAKTRRDLDAWMDFFHPDHVSYFDATLGGGMADVPRAGLRGVMAPVVAAWAEGAKSYPLRVLGNTDSAIVVFLDTPEMFGAELRIMASITFEDGKIVRQVDYWDGRRSAALNLRDQAAPYPDGLGLETARANADPVIDKVARKLGSSLAVGDAAGAEALFSVDAVFEDMTTRTLLHGRSAIGRYLRRALPELPYGLGAAVVHVLGSARGGGYEWVTDGRSVPNGITALELDQAHEITRLTALWDGSRLDDSAMRSLAVLSLEE